MASTDPTTPSTCISAESVQEITDRVDETADLAQCMRLLEASKKERKGLNAEMRKSIDTIVLQASPNFETLLELHDCHVRKALIEAKIDQLRVKIDLCVHPDKENIDPKKKNNNKRKRAPFQEPLPKKIKTDDLSRPILKRS